MSSIELKLNELDLSLPTAPPPVGYYVPVLRTGNLVITSGQLPFIGKQLAFTGHLGAELHEEDGRNAARICVLNALSQIKACLGSIEKVRQVVRVEGYVLSAPGFTNQPQVLNAASELLVHLFGEQGKHVRTAVGVAEMPMNAAVQLALWVEA